MRKTVKIEIANRQSRQRINRALLRKVLTHTMRDASVSGTLSVAVVDSAEMTELNHRFLKRSEPTDVLSFPMQDEDSDLFGEVVVCAEIAAEEASKRKISFDAELTLYALHGLLHLLGYDDKISAQQKQMRKRELEILEKFF